MRLRVHWLAPAIAAVAASAVMTAPASAAERGSAPNQPDMVTQWDLTMINGLEAAATPPPPAARVAAIVQTSVFDAVNGITRRFTYYHVPATGPRSASADAAAAGAAYTALVALIPAQQPMFGTELSASLAELAKEHVTQRAIKQGLTWGTTVANDILAWRANDGFTTVPPPYVPGTDPGDWQPTPPLFGPPLFRQFATLTPFALTSPAQFLPPAPPSLTSQLYATDLAEVQAYGSASSTVRTAEQTQTAVFWNSDNPTTIWNRVADQLAARFPATPTERARQLALMNIALADATIAIWNAKNVYNRWRPVTAIRATSDPNWTPLLTTPAFQEYPSGHSGVSNAAASVLASFYGDNTSFTVTAAGLPGVERDFTSFSSAIQQVEDARVYGGIHFRFSCVVAAAMGSEVAQYVLATLMHPADD